MAAPGTAAIPISLDAVSPDADIHDLLAAVLRVERIDPNRAVMVGDRSHDMIGARANGVRAIGVLWGYGSRQELEAAGADGVAPVPDDLVNCLLT